MLFILSYYHLLVTEQWLATNAFRWRSTGELEMQCRQFFSGLSRPPKCTPIYRRMHGQCSPWFSVTVPRHPAPQTSTLQKHDDLIYNVIYTGESWVVRTATPQKKKLGTRSASGHEGKFHLARHVTSRHDTTRSTCRAHAFGSVELVDTLVSTRFTCRTCHVVCRRDVTSQVEFEL